MRLGLLEVDRVSEKFRSIAGEYHEMFGRWIRRAIPGVEVQSYDVCHGDLPGSTDACDVYVCGASRYSVFEEHAWIAPLTAFVRALADEGRPFVGVCFGHQLIASALGGRVVRGEAWGIGVHAIDLIARESWMQPWQERVHLLHSHQDQVDALPPDAVVLARSAHCPVAMFRVGRSLLGIQAHPELVRPYLDALMVDRIPRIGEGPVRDARATLSLPTDEDVVGRWVREFLGESLDGSTIGPTTVGQRARHAGRRSIPSHP